MKKVDFSIGGWSEESIITAYSFRFTETPEFTQKNGYITTCANKDHREGFDNISLLTQERYGRGVEITLRCAFEVLGCPEIIIVEKMEDCEDGAVRYGPCFEVVLYKNGINVWRHYRENGKCFWHKRLGMEFPVTEDEEHTLVVMVQEKTLLIKLDGQKTVLRVDDLPEAFHVGLTGCEGIVRFYEMLIDDKQTEE